MCLLILSFQALEEHPLLVAENREESLVRKSVSPQIDGRAVRFLAPRDRLAGGTWIGVNAAGTLVAVLNRPDLPIPPNPRSRGLLACEMLDSGPAAAALAHGLDELSRGIYAGCNILIASRDAATLIEGGSEPMETRIEPGIAVISNGPLQDDANHRAQFVTSRIPEFRPEPESWLEDARETLSRHAMGDAPAVCLHEGAYGTVSSTVIGLSNSPENALFHYTPGPPCRTDFEDHSPTLRQLLKSG